MATIIGGSSVTGGGDSNIPATSSPGATISYDANGDIVVAVDNDLKANSGAFGAGISAQTATAEDNFLASDPETGNAIEVDPNDGITANSTQVTVEMLKGIVAANPSGSDPLARLSQASSAPEVVVPKVRIGMMPSNLSVASASSLTIDSENVKFAYGFTLPFAAPLSSLSVYLPAITTQGNINLTLHANGSGLDAEGAIEGKFVQEPIVMTANNAPSPYVVALLDSTGADCSTVPYYAYKALLTSNNSAFTDCALTTTVPSGVAPVYYTLDVGDGNSLILNAGEFNTRTGNNRSITEFTLWGSNLASPDPTNDANYTQIGGTITLEACNANYSSRWSVQNTTGYRHYRWKITACASTNLTISMRLYSPATIDVPGTQLADLGAIDSGEAGTLRWVRGTFTEQLLAAHTKYWIVGTGSSGASYTVGYNRNRAVAKTEPMDTIDSLIYDNGHWRHTYIDSITFRGYFNVSLNSNTNHVPKLMCGQYGGNRIPLYISSAWVDKTIGASGLSLDLEGLTAGALYWIYCYDNSGLALEASTTVPTLQDGIRVKTGDTSYRLLGAIVPHEYISGHVGPMDQRDARLIWNQYNRATKSLGKTCPYYAITYDLLDVVASGTGVKLVDKWYSPLGSEVYDLYLAMGEESLVDILAGGGYSANVPGAIIYGLNGRLADRCGAMSSQPGGTIPSLQVPFPQHLDIPVGGHRLRLMYCANTQRQFYYWNSLSSTSFQRFSTLGRVEV